jgi:hypothetical protein
MDTIASYFPDPVTSNKMLNVIKNYACLTVKSTMAMAALQLALYDNYNKINDHCACLFLLNSMIVTLKNKVQDKILVVDGFAILLLQFIKCIQCTSI